jgi:hypothetical protein
VKIARQEEITTTVRAHLSHSTHFGAYAGTTGVPTAASPAPANYSCPCCSCPCCCPCPYCCPCCHSTAAAPAPAIPDRAAPPAAPFLLLPPLPPLVLLMLLLAPHVVAVAIASYSTCSCCSSCYCCSCSCCCVLIPVVLLPMMLESALEGARNNRFVGLVLGCACVEGVDIYTI